MNKILIVLVVVLLLAAGGIFVWQNFSGQTNAPATNEPVACTMEAKICPDGSSVGRTGPKCEFSPCPLPSDWKTSNEGGVEFKYPETLTTKYIDTQEWPPKVTVATGEFTCAETPLTSSLPERVTRRTVDSRVYCMEEIIGAAAGSTYIEYTYTTARDGKLIAIKFTLRYPQCLNYDNPKQSECLAERETFDMDGVVDRIAATVELK
ncbi:hypothetical protein HZB93_03850 [Candidatus Falkowbacteria bacterium]|nr:hypothetical protein [Candidatus Falkowbacteria bacterium]